MSSMLGLKRGSVELSKYNAEWANIFETEKRAIESKLGDLALGIEHVGSTSIPGMQAKPILDLAIAVKSIDDYGECTHLLQELGYQYVPRDKATYGDDLLFVKGSDDNRTHHLKLTVIGSPFWEKSILFRNYLVKHPSAAKEYEDLKLQLAANYPVDRESYTEGKNEFIERILKDARRKK